MILIQPSVVVGERGRKGEWKEKHMTIFTVLCQHKLMYMYTPSWIPSHDLFQFLLTWWRRAGGEEGPTYR